MALALLVLELARINGIADDKYERLVAELATLPRVIGRGAQAASPRSWPWPSTSSTKHHALFLGRGVNYPVAMEGALKLKEISYIHAEAYPAGELKHGPLALVDEDMPVIAVAPNNQLLEKLKSNLEEVRARGGELFVIADREIPSLPRRMVAARWCGSSRAGTSSRRWCSRFRCSCSPTTSPCCAAPTWTSRATWPSR